jgi:hypothetical protein
MAERVRLHRKNLCAAAARALLRRAKGRVLLRRAKRRVLLRRAERRLGGSCRHNRYFVNLAGVFGLMTLSRAHAELCVLRKAAG